MRVFLEPEVLKWLANVLCIDSSTINYTLNNSGKCEIRAEDLIEEIGLGITMGEVIKSLRSLNRGVLGDLKDSAKLDLLKKTKSGGARAYNWNILFEQLQTLLDLKVDKGMITINQKQKTLLWLQTTKQLRICLVQSTLKPN